MFEIDGSTIKPDNVKVKYESNSTEETINQSQTGSEFIIGASSEDDWTAKTSLGGTDMIVTSTGSTSGNNVNTLYGLKILSMSCQGKTYTQFNFK